MRALAQEVRRREAGLPGADHERVEDLARGLNADGGRVYARAHARGSLGAWTLPPRATRLLELHHTGTTLVLPNVWDAWSARAVADAGFAALSIGSHPLADSRGQGDNEDMSLDDALDGVRRICSAVPDAPVTADMEAGYGATPAELVERLLEAGAVGLNIEDTVHSEGGRMRSVAEHADYIGGCARRPTRQVSTW